jgi:hypothetical protein
MRFQIAIELLNFGAFVGFILVNLSVIKVLYYCPQAASRLGSISQSGIPSCWRANLYLRVDEP